MRDRDIGRSSSLLRSLEHTSYYHYDQQALSLLRLSNVCKRRRLERQYVH